MTLVGDDANEILGRCQAIDNDWSLDALVRAIVIKYGNYSTEELSMRTSVERHRARYQSDIEEFLSSSFKNEALTIVECHNCFNETIVSSGWETEFTFKDKPFPVNQYLSQFGRTKVYLNQEYKRVVALVDRRATNIWVQALESVLCRLMPWYYPADLPEEEQKFYKSIAVDNKTIPVEEKVEIFVRYVNEVAEKINFREMKLHKLLDGIADKARLARIVSLESSVASVRTLINQLTSDMVREYGKLESALLELNGLKNAEPETNDAMFKFFNTHKQVHLLNVANDYLDFGVDDTLEFYDDEEFSRMYQSHSSYLSDYNERIRKGLKAIFEEKKGVIRVNAMFTLYQFKLVEPRQDDSFVSESMPNPHIYFFGCSGGNSQYYAQYAESGDWDLAIEQAISATKNLSWGDTTVCQRMIRWLTDSHSYIPCIYINDELQPIEKVTKEMRLVSFDEFVSKIELEQGDKANG